VFIDGRNEVMGEPFYREYLRLKSLETFPAALNRWKLQAALVPHNDLPLWFHQLREDPRWGWVYGDDRHAVFVRRSFGGGLSHSAVPRPGEEYPVFNERQTDEILLQAGKVRMPSFAASLLASQYEPHAELGGTLLFLRAGYPEAARGLALEGLRRATFPAPELLAVLGHAFYDLDDFERAARCFDASLRWVDDPLARERLDLIRNGRR
jgi:hypothetical protein